jgi:predicted ribosome quality control (RQC) complex YloA/Tae2 family protein
MSIRWDPVLARHLARELDRALGGARVRALRLDGEARDLALLLEDCTLLWALHPSRGWLRVVAPASPVESDLELRGRISAVRSPDDERIIHFELAPVDGRSVTLVVELLGNQWNALLVEGEAREGPGVIRHVLVRREGARPQRVGESYRAPEAFRRLGVGDDVTRAEWATVLGQAPDADRARALVRAFAWTSTLNAQAMVGSAGPAPSPTALDAGYALWRSIATGEIPADPVLLELASGAQPYPFPLPGTSYRPADSLLAAFATCAELAGQAEGTAGPLPDPGLVDALAGALRLAEGREARLESELGGLENPVALRSMADLILARYEDILPGASRAQLTGFDGQVVDVELDPAKPPHVNAAAMYQRATKSERAAVQLPKLLAQARAARERVADLLRRARAGSVDEAEVRAVLGAGSARSETRRKLQPSLPYRVFRSSGGLEIRVGRGAAHNDDLTFHHSAPGDVWLHARHVGGAHVILRWTGPGNPPQRDLAEAATLAALHSKARTSRSVPVDWTFRKYVRKPRKAPPGSVAAERFETLFVRPDATLLSALRHEAAE